MLKLDEGEFINEAIIIYKETTDRKRRKIMAFIFKNGIKICVCASHPNFVQAKVEETSRLIDNANHVIHVELTEEPYNEKHEKLAQELEKELEEDIEEEIEAEIQAVNKSKKKKRASQKHEKL